MQRLYRWQGGSGAAAAPYAATGRAAKPADTSRSGNQSQRSSIGEKVNQGLHAAGSALCSGRLTASPVNPIGWYNSKRWQKPRWQYDDGNYSHYQAGQFEFTIAEAGNYRFVLTAPVDTDPQGKSIK